MDIRKKTSRFILVFVFLLACLSFYAGKLLLMQIFRAEHLSALAERQHTQYVKIEPVRGTIYDRQLRPLAVNEAVYSLYANPRSMKEEDKAEALARLPGLLGLDPAVLTERLSRDKFFVWLERKLPMDQADAVKRLKIRGLDFIKESRRNYPNKFLAAHLIGFAGMDNQGLEGLELQFDSFLRGEYGWSHIIRDARQRELMLEKDFVPPKDGLSLVLTIDETLQYIAERALEKGVEAHHPQGATLIAMDPRTGEILALANRPAYNLEAFADSPVESRTNRGVVYVYEPGSVFKIVAASAALEEGIAKETDTFYCENGEYRVGGHILHDHHPHGTLTFREVFEQSSNICTSKIAQKLGPEAYYKYAHRFRFGMKTGIDLVGEVSGLLKPPREWSKTSIAAIPMGHEVMVTPLQLLGAIATIANGGVYMKPYVVKYIKDNREELIKAFYPRAVDRVISEDTAARVRSILQGVVDNGTGRMARIDGVAVAGKTGTAQKVINGQYSHDQFYASFIGFAPVEDPKLAVVVTFDDPRGTHFGGTVAAPVFKEFVENSLKYLAARDGETVMVKNAVPPE